MLVSLLRYSVASGNIRLGLVLEVWYIALGLVLAVYPSRSRASGIFALVLVLVAI